MKSNFSRIKIMLLFIGFISIQTGTMAQSGLIIEASQLYSTFKFKDSNGTNLNSDYSGIYTGAYNIGYRFTNENGVLLRGGIGMRKAGATMVYDGYNYLWDLQYTDIKLGGGYIYNAGRLKPYLSISGYFAYLLKANQTINNQNFDILKSKSINNTDYGIFIAPGVQMNLSENISAYTEFNYMLGLKNLENDNSGDKSHNSAFGLTLGVSFTISK